MKQTIIALSITALLSVGNTGCSDFLDQPALGKESLDTYFQTEEECLNQINGCYEAIHWNSWWEIRKFINTTSMCTDDMWMGNTAQDASEYRDLAHYTGNAQTDATQNFWQYRYKGIFRTNVCLERIPEAPITDEDLRKRMIAEAKFLRAYFYFDLVINFGGVPILHGFLQPSDVQGITRSSVAETYKVIEDDLVDAIPDLPLRSEYPDADLGRITKGAAQALLGKVYLFQEKYDEAETMLQYVIDSNEYEILPNFGDVWDITTNNSREGIFEVQNAYDEILSLGCSLAVTSGARENPDGDGWAWGLPTSHLEKAFLDAGDTERLKWTIIKHGDEEVAGDPDATLPFQAPITSHKSGRINRKFYIPVAKRPAQYAIEKIPMNFRIIRYADVLLMQAEVKNALGKDAEARTLLDPIRERANLNKFTAETGTTLRDAIRLERRLELALENHRLADIRRWKGDDGKPLVTSIMGANGSFVRYNTQESTDEFETVNDKEASNKGYNFNETRDLLFPIPYSEVSMSNNSIEQNPGY
ncbi:MAG: RagB/SusD family nutrient uptake outer membrane protein [Tannerellaceae bacterium]|nr:RagB/SusD family nutrient uptake outer membrane protein [Tannerellaceae bacterium]